MQQSANKINPRIAVIIGALLISLFGFLIYRSVQFHIIKTDPKLSSVSAIAPYIKVYFNDTLKPNGYVLSDPKKIVTSSNVNGKVLTMNLGSDLTAERNYAVVIKRISNTSGKTLENKVIAFTARSATDVKLSKEQQKTLVARQDAPIYDSGHINYPHFDDLLEYGITPEQIQSMKDLLFDYSNVVHKKYWTMSLNPNSIVVKNHDPSSYSSTDSVDFKVTLDKVIYIAHAEYDTLYDSVHLQLRSADGTIVYDSANGTD